MAGVALRADESLVLLPDRFTLSGPAARQTLLLERTQDNHFTGPIANVVQFSISAPGVVSIENGIVVPLTNGAATITAKAGDWTARAEVTVTGLDQPLQWSFRNHVQPVLAKFGCSSGACHGAAAGQNGFKLSLRGYDDEGDYRAITRHALGRRIVTEDPGRSLLLLKPTGAVPHKGGRKFDTDSLEYRVLSGWIAAGTPPPRPSDPRIGRLEILPERVVLSVGSSQPLLVRAHFSDGQVKEVTRWVKYTDANATVTQVDDAGQVRVVGHGEGAIIAWYLSRLAIATVTVPYTNPVPAAIFAQAGRRNFVDEGVLEKLQSLNLPPSPRSSDAEFVRRVYLDTLGILPTAQEAREFLAGTARDKRDQLIESLLRRPEFVDYWTYKWSDLLLVNSERLKPATMWSYYNWIRNQVAANTPWDRMVRAILTAKGSTLENGAGNFFALHEDPPGMAETTSQAFLGLSINCAKCHNHPLEKWTNDEYFGFANLFARVRAKNGTRDGERVIFVAQSGDLPQPLTGRPQKPRPLDGAALSMDDPDDRREPLADWLTSRRNPYFGRALANRIWANFFGVGLVETVDDLRMTNPASNEKLLSAAANYLADHEFDLKALMRAILQSETYQRTSRPLPENAADQRFYSRYYPKRLMAEVLLDAFAQVTGAPSKFPNYPDGWRALQLPDTKVKSYFLEIFGRPERLKTCECERTTEPSMSQVLHIANGDTVNQKLKAKGNRLEKLLADSISNENIVETAFLSALSRYPSEDERAKMVQILTEAKPEERRLVVEDVFWAVLSSKEFLFNH